MHLKDIVITTVSTGERPEIPNDLPDSLAELIESGWDKDPTERPPLSEIIETLKSMTTENFDGDKKLNIAKSMKLLFLLPIRQMK